MHINSTTPRQNLKNYCSHLCLVIALGGLLVTAQAQEPIRIGLFTELSGSFAAAAGADCKRGYDLARSLYAPQDKLKQRPIQFIYGDTRGEARVAVSEFQKLLEIDKAHLLVTNRSQVGMALNPIAAKRRFPVVGVIGQSDFLSTNPYSFQFWPSAKSEAAFLAKKIKAGRFKSLALISLQDEWFISFRNNVLKSLAGETLRIISDDEVQQTTNLDPYIAKIRSLKPETILVNLGPGQIGVFIRKLREQGVTQPIFGNYYARIQAEINAAGSAMEGVTLEELALDRPNFLERHANYFPGKDVSSLVYTCFSGLAFALQALADKPQVSSPQEVFAALAAKQSIKLPDEELFLKDRELQYNLAYKVIRQGKLEVLNEKD